MKRTIVLLALLLLALLSLRGTAYGSKGSLEERWVMQSTSPQTSHFCRFQIMNRDLRNDDQSLWHGKILKVAMGGGKPWFYVENGELKGSDVMLVRLLSKKLGFKYDMRVVGWHNLVVEMVS